MNVVKWKEEEGEYFLHTGRTFEIDSEDLGLVNQHSSTVSIDSKYPLEVSEKKMVHADGRTILNIAITHKLIGLLSDYYIYNDLAMDDVEEME